MQAFRRFTANPVVIILLTGLAFAIPHLPNLVGMKLPWYADVLYLIDGSLLAWLAYRTSSLWMPIGWHFANNFLLTTLLGIKDAGDVIQGLPFIVGDKAPSLEVLILAKALSSLVSVLILAWLIRRREKKTEASPSESNS
jgi:membrane protease YdiL (CAAX protease family)